MIMIIIIDMMMVKTMDMVKMMMVIVMMVMTMFDMAVTLYHYRACSFESFASMMELHALNTQQDDQTNPQNESKHADDHLRRIADEILFMRKSLLDRGYKSSIVDTVFEGLNISETCQTLPSIESIQTILDDLIATNLDLSKVSHGTIVY